MNADANSLSRRPKLRFWGWGYADENLSSEEESLVDMMAGGLLPEGSVFVEEPREEDFELPPPRIEPPAELAEICSSHRYDRLVHSFGKSFPDLARMFLAEVPEPPDLVAFPRTEDDISALLRFAGENDIAVIPFGGGTSVCGGVEAAVGASYRGTISLDMECFNQLVDVDEVSRTATIQAGMFGPDIDAALKPYGLTLRHFPQSYQFSTLGGWVATRSGGHFATLYTHIDDLVESVRMVTPEGVIETRRLPGSGAGPSPDRMLLGSEGILGVITQVSIRLQARPRYKATASVLFDEFEQAANAVRLIAQAGLYPANCRLLDADEAFLNGVTAEPRAVLVLGFESADRPMDAPMARAVTIAREQGGKVNDDSIQIVATADRGTAASESGNTEAAAWKNSFLRLPYYKNRLIQHGLIADTFETSITWERLPAFYRALKTDIATAVREITGHDGFVSCRFTHVYPDGPCVYITFIAVGDVSGDIRAVLENWCRIKAVANERVIALGGTVTHHHAVGRDHRSGYEQQVPPLFRATLASAKATVDPRGILNPGVLIDPVDRDVGITGAMADYS